MKLPNLNLRDLFWLASRRTAFQELSMVNAQICTRSNKPFAQASVFVLAWVASGLLHGQDLRSAGNGQDQQGHNEAIPAELKDVIGQWTFDEDGKIESVDFTAGDPFKGRRLKAEDIKHLAPLQNLEQVEFPSDAVTDTSLEAIGQLARLKRLAIPGVKVTSKGIKHLKPLKRLVVLDLAYTDIDDDAMEVIATFGDLEVLNVSDTDVSDAGIAHLRFHKRLGILVIGNTQNSNLIGDKAVPLLANIKSLRRLDITFTRIRDIHTLEKALPECEVIY